LTNLENISTKNEQRSTQYHGNKNTIPGFDLGEFSWIYQHQTKTKDALSVTKTSTLSKINVSEGGEGMCTFTNVYHTFI
jgi:hypothetical protein